MMGPGSPLTRFALAGIDAYQRHLSPRKGYRCAHAVLNGGVGCSGAVRSQIATLGLLGAVGPAVARGAACSAAYRTLSAQRAAGVRVEGFCCCNGIPIPIRF